MDPTLVTNLFGAVGLGAASGLNAWIPLLGLGLAQRFGLVSVSPSFQAIGSTPVLIALGVLFIVDLVGDKVPVLDHLLHVVGFVIAPASAAIVVAAQQNLLSNASPAMAGLLGVVLGGVVHAGRSTVRPVVTAGTAGVGNPVVSTVEDVVSTVLTVLAVVVPVLAFVVLIGLLWWAVIAVRRWRRRRVGGSPDVRAAPPPTA